MEINFGNFQYILLGLLYRKTLRLSKRRICEGREVAVGLGWEVSLSKDVKMGTFTLKTNLRVQPINFLFCSHIQLYGYLDIKVFLKNYSSVKSNILLKMWSYENVFYRELDLCCISFSFPYFMNGKSNHYTRVNVPLRIVLPKTVLSG